MRRKGISVSQSRPRTGSGRKTLRSCKNKRETNIVFVIDVDSDNMGNFITVDVRGSKSGAPRKDNNCSLKSVICIDDDDGENTEHNNLDEGLFVQETRTPVKLSKCKRTYSGKASLEAGSSDDDGSDVEVGSSSGKLKEQWEKAFLKRQNNEPSMDDRAGTRGCCGREMLKQTDEYKRATEAELASRERALQIQAEEAKQLQRLEKRKRAESTRLLDMERRQKQRIEEIRETQKKDEDNLNLKDKLRAEVRKDLSRLETLCYDMASVLRALGIHVNGANEVPLAFKRALLSFHPDRASQSDIHQQVEAEEKFKLITRMKEKFSTTS